MGPRRIGWTHVLKVGRDGAHDLRRDGNHVLGIGRDGARTQGVERDGAYGLEVRRDEAHDLGVGRYLLIRHEPSREVIVGANFFALGIPNIDTRHICSVLLL